MTDALSSMEYPHWLIIVGAVLLMLGLVGRALRARSVEDDPSDMTNNQEPSEPEADLTPAEVYERAAKEKRRARWAESERARNRRTIDRAFSARSRNDRADLIWIRASRLETLITSRSLRVAMPQKLGSRKTIRRASRSNIQ